MGQTVATQGQSEAASGGSQDLGREARNDLKSQAIRVSAERLKRQPSPRTAYLRQRLWGRKLGK